MDYIVSWIFVTALITSIVAFEKRKLTFNFHLIIANLHNLTKTEI